MSASRALLAIASVLLAPLVVYFRIIDAMRFGADRRAMQKDLGKKLLFIYSQVAWDEVWQRPQEYAMHAAETRDVIYCCPVQVHSVLATLRKRWRPIRVIMRGENRLIVLSPLVFSGHFKRRGIFDANCALVAGTVLSWIGKRTAVCGLLNTPLGLPVVRRTLEQKGQTGILAFDVIDDFTAFEWSPRWSKAMDEELTVKADAVFTGTRELMIQKQTIRADVEFIPSGVDFDLFSMPTPEPTDIAGLPRPIIGYFGTISERIDLELVDAIAKEFPKASVVLVGPVHLDPASLPHGAGNVHFFGLKPHSELPAFAQKFAVGLIPFRITRATEKLNPIKTLEYLAAGVPVVSTAIPDVVNLFSSVVRIANDHKQFIEAVRDTLEGDNSSRRKAGIELARRSSWGAMASRMTELLDQGVANRVARRETRVS